VLRSTYKLRLELYNLVPSSKNERDNGNGPITFAVANHKARRKPSYEKRMNIYKLGAIGKDHYALKHLRQNHG
jgi:hypothetical protein